MLQHVLLLLLLRIFPPPVQTYVDSGVGWGVAGAGVGRSVSMPAPHTPFTLFSVIVPFESSTFSAFLFFLFHISKRVEREREEKIAPTCFPGEKRAASKLRSKKREEKKNMCVAKCSRAQWSLLISSHCCS